MSFWSRDLRERDAELVDSLSHTPSGGRLKLWLLGVGVALIPVGYGIRCLLAGQATLFGKRGARLELTGSEAFAMAIAYFAIGVFIHAHWFWGLHPKLEGFSSLLKTMSLLAFLGGLGYTAFNILKL
jgi:hypothetical protein